MISKEFLKELAEEYKLTEAEFAALSLAIRGMDTSEIASSLGIRDDAVRKRLSEIYKKFQIVGNGPVKLPKLQQLVVSRYQEYQKNKSRLHSDWGEAPSVPDFYGRDKEFATLEKWLVQDRCRLVALLGMKGIGKTALAVKLAKQLQDRFDYVVWRSLFHAPLLQDLSANLIQFLSNQQENPIPAPSPDPVSQLIAYLRHHRCLIILDNLEAIVAPGKEAGQWEPGYSNYGELIKRVGETPHQSCLLLTSLDKPEEIVPLAGNTQPVRALQLNGLELDSAREIFRAKELSDREKWPLLVKHYQGNPLALKLVSTTIQELFNGSVSLFLKHNSFLLGGISTLLARQFERLSDLEQAIMYWLALKRQPVSIDQLVEDIFPPISLGELLSAMSSLKLRSLIETRTENGEVFFTLQLVLMEYVHSLLSEQLSKEIAEVMKKPKPENLELFKIQVLTNGTPDSQAANQKNLIVRKIINQLYKDLSSKEIEECLKGLLSMLQERSHSEVGYAASNIDYLLAELQKS